MHYAAIKGRGALVELLVLAGPPFVSPLRNSRLPAPPLPTRQDERQRPNLECIERVCSGLVALSFCPANSFEVQREVLCPPDARIDPSEALHFGVTIPNF